MLFVSPWCMPSTWFVCMCVLRVHMLLKALNRYTDWLHSKISNLQSSPKPFDQIMDISGSTYMFFLHSCSIHGVDSQSDPWLWRSVKTRFKKPSKTSKKNSNSQLQKPQNLWETAMWRLARVGRLRRQSVRRFAAAPSVRRGWRWCSNWKSGFHYGLWSVWL